MLKSWREKRPKSNRDFGAKVPFEVGHYQKMAASVQVFEGTISLILNFFRARKGRFIFKQTWMQDDEVGEMASSAVEYFHLYCLRPSS